MATLQTGRLVVLLLGCALIVGCFRFVTLPDGTKVSKDEYRAQQAEAHNERIADKVMSKITDCHPDMTEKEATECRWSNAFMAVVLPEAAKELTANSDYWQYRAQTRQFWLQVVTLGLNNPFTQAYAYDKFGGGSSSGSTVKIVARDGSRVENIDLTQGNRSPFITGEGAVAAVGSSVASDEGNAANRDGQNMLGDNSNQAQVQTDPPFINNPQAPFTIESGTGIQLP